MPTSANPHRIVCDMQTGEVTAVDWTPQEWAAFQQQTTEWEAAQAAIKQVPTVIDKIEALTAAVLAVSKQQPIPPDAADVLE